MENVRGWKRVKYQELDWKNHDDSVVKDIENEEGRFNTPADLNWPSLN